MKRHRDQSLGHAAACPGAALWGVVAVIALLIGACSPKDDPSAKAVIAIPGKARFRAAGYVVASTQGLFAREGATVDLAFETADVAGALTRGEASYGVMPGAEAMVRRLKGEDLVVVSAVFQHATLGLMSPDDGTVLRPADLVGKTIVLQATPESAAWRAVLRDAGVDPLTINFVTDEPNYELLGTGGVDAAGADLAWAREMLRIRNVPVRVFRAGNYGHDFYGDVLVTTGTHLSRSPRQAEAVRRAVAQGWENALATPGPVAEEILAKYGPAEPGADAGVLVAEAEWLRTLIRPDLSPVGTQMVERWRRLAKTLVSLGDVTIDERAMEARLEGFAWTGPKQYSRTPILVLGVLLAGAALTAVAVLAWNVQLRRVVASRTGELEARNEAMRTEVRERARAERALAEQVIRTELLHSISTGVNEGLAAEDLISRSVRDLSEAFAGCGVGYWSGGEGPSLIARAGAPATPGLRLPVPGVDQTIAVADVHADEALSEHRRALDGAGMRAVLVVPLLLGEEILGWLGVWSGSARAWTQNEVSTVETVASHLAGGAMVAAIEEERRVAVTKLRRSELQYRRLFESNPEPMWVYDTRTLRFLAVNDATVAKYGFTREEFDRMTVEDIRPPEDVARLREWLRQVRADPRALTPPNVMRHRTKGGRVLHVRVIGYEAEFIAPNARLAIAHDVTELRAAEQSLRERESELSRRLTELENLYGSAPIAMALFDLDLRCVRANERISAIFGRSAGELRGVGIEELRIPGAGDDLGGLLTEVRRSGRALENVGLDVQRDHSMTSHFRATIYPVRAEDATIQGVGAMLLDVTPLVRAQRLRERYERALTQIVTHEPLGRVFETLIEAVEAEHPTRVCSVAVADPERRTLRLTAAGAGLSPTMRGSAAELPIRADLGVCPVAAAEKRRVISEDIQTDPRCGPFREIAGADGLRSCWSEPILTGEREVLGTIAVYGRERGAPGEAEQALVQSAAQLAGLAIEHHQAEESLRESHRQLERSQQVGRIGRWVWTMEGGRDVVEWSDETCRIFGIAPGQFDGTLDAFFEKVHPDDSARIRSAIDSAMIDRREYRVDMRIFRADGAVRWIHTRGDVERDEAGTPVRMLGVVQDITDQKLASDELERSNIELERFAYTASHDLQEPLRMVSSFAHLLSERLEHRLDTEEREFLGYVIEGSMRMTRLVDDLLTYARVGLGPRIQASVSAQSMAARAVANLRQLAEEAHAQVDIGDLPAVQADETQLTQVFQNLIANAMKFRGDSPALVRVFGEREDGMVTITVEDCGIGIAPEDRSRIFEMFQRAHARKLPRGTGLGLAICKRIVERHGGRLWVEPHEPRGSRFRFTMPIAEAIPEIAPMDTTAVTRG